MQMHRKKRLEIVIEAPIVDRLVALLDKAGVTGYTVTPALAGRGREGKWRREGQVTATGQMHVIMSIIDPGRVDEVVEQVYPLVSRHIGILSVADVDVIRKDYF
jgi:nitrogen regulatory protein PII